MAYSKGVDEWCMQGSYDENNAWPFPQSYLLLGIPWVFSHAWPVCTQQGGACTATSNQWETYQFCCMTDLIGRMMGCLMGNWCWSLSVNRQTSPHNHLNKYYIYEPLTWLGRGYCGALTRRRHVPGRSQQLQVYDTRSNVYLMPNYESPLVQANMGWEQALAYVNIAASLRRLSAAAGPYTKAERI